MNIRTATLQDIDQIAAVEKECFPAAEAATKEEFEQRLSHYADHFWLLFEDDTLIAFVDGMVTDQEDLTDEMYENASMHQENGAWQMIFGVNTLPAYRNHGYAGELLKRAIADAKDQGRKGPGEKEQRQQERRDGGHAGHFVHAGQARRPGPPQGPTRLRPGVFGLADPVLQPGERL